MDIRRARASEPSPRRVAEGPPEHRSRKRSRARVDLAIAVVLVLTLV
ncbi:MAG: hypothetical protein QOE06_374, partial [Thermoleophilaceae bacterium]|nr:hypothetical protein [Thermoleophilaceae bacterium]